MEKRNEETKKPLPIEKVTIFNPEDPPYQVQHLCIYLRELEEEESSSGRGEE